MAATKQDDFQPFPVKEQLPGVDYCITSSPPWPEAVLLGFQHYIVVLGTTVLIPSILVPQMGGGDHEKARVIQTLLFVAGLNTLLQCYLGTRLPAVIGGSFTFIVPTISIILANRYNNILDPHQRFLQTMRAIQGALIAASSFQIIAGFSGLWRNVVRMIETIQLVDCSIDVSSMLTACSLPPISGPLLLIALGILTTTCTSHHLFPLIYGWIIISWYLSPLSAVPLVALSGFGLYTLGFPGVAKCIEIGLPQLILLIFLSQYVPHLLEKRRYPFDRFAVLLSVAIVWLYAYFLTIGGAYKHRPLKTQQHCRTDRAGLIGAAPWFKVPYPFQWGAPTFNAGECFAMMVASMVSLIESTGTFYAVQRYASATPIPPSCLSRGVGWQGMAILFDGMFGTANGSTVSVENAGLLGLTRVGSRRVIQIAAGFMLFFSVLGKFGAVFASIPMSIVAALYCVLFAYVGSAGLGFLQFCNLNSFRTKFILGISIFLGLSIPQYFNEYTVVSGYGPVHTHARWFNDMVTVVFSSPATVAAIVAFFLDCTLHRGDSARRRDRGWHWWAKYRFFKSDTRSEEFYSLPYNLNKYFPSI